MTEYLAEHWVLSIVVTILLGAVGSGLWEAALKPLTRKIGGVIFMVITFGAKRARDGVYRQAAMGHHELPSLYILLIVLCIGIASLVATQLRLYVVVYAPEVAEQLLSNCEEDRLDKQAECVREAVKKNVMPTLQIASLVAIFAAVVIFYRFVTINRTNLVTTYYEQCLKAVRPLLSESEALIIEQQYALMTTKEDYLAILDKLEVTAAANKMTLPASYV